MHIIENINSTEEILVVVPDGLIINKNGKSYPTTTFENVLINVLIKFKNKKRKVLLLPGNDFGSKCSEEIVAKEYLYKNGINKDFLITGNKSKKGYVDTIDNFREVIINEGTLNKKKTFISKNLLEGRYKLFTSHLHVERVINAIKLIKLGNPNEIFCSYAFEEERLPLRLIHYKHPILRYLYEFFATIYQEIRVYFSKILLNRWISKR